jgi:hypothetical protein
LTADFSIYLPHSLIAFGLLAADPALRREILSRA